MKRAGWIVGGTFAIVLGLLGHRTLTVFAEQARHIEVFKASFDSSILRQRRSAGGVEVDGLPLVAPSVHARGTIAPSVRGNRLAAATEQVYEILRTPHNVFNTLEEQAREIASSPIMLQQLVAVMEAIPTIDADGALERVPERIRGFDLVETIASLPEVDDVVTELCQFVLISLVRRAVHGSATFAIKEAIVADKHDALAAITRVNSGLAVDLYREFSSEAQREFMGSALLLGLVDLGLERAAAQRYILSIP